jgi:DNA-binding FadR family transcriptional regulator
VELTQADVISIFEAEDIIETRCAELAAKRITKEELSLMESLLEIMKKHRNNRKKYSAADYEFHATIVNAARNPIISELMKIVRRMELRAIERTVLDTGLTRRDLTMRYHHRIYEAVKNGDSAKASALTHQHLTETITRYSRVVKARGNGRPK